MPLFRKIRCFYLNLLSTYKYIVFYGKTTYFSNKR